MHWRWPAVLRRETLNIDGYAFVRNASKCRVGAMPHIITGMHAQMMRTTFLPFALTLCVLSSQATHAQVAYPFERGDWPIAMTQLDELVQGALRERGIEPAHPCSDAVFIRRVYLDLIGTLPDAQEVRVFLGDGSAGKREKLIESLFARNEFADYRTLKWCDILRVKAEFPINLWPNAVQAYHRWIHDAVRTNMPYDQFARELLTSSGSNFRVPQVNFYRAVQGRDPAAIAQAVALTFMGTRLEAWPETDRANMQAFFSRIAYKKTAEWKEEIVQPDPEKTGAFDATLPDGTQVAVTEGQDPRVVFADWLIAPDNKWFARAVVNRVWSWFMGRGIIHEPDDIRPDNPAVNPQLLAYLEKEFAASGYDLRQLFRIILNSRTYQQSCISRSDDPDAEKLFACYPARRLEAEVLVDALCKLGGDRESYSSPIPEPFTYIPEEQRTIALADGSITSQFLEMFGRPARDTGLESERNNEPSDAQRLHLLNSTDIHQKVGRSPVLTAILMQSRWNRSAVVDGIYLAVLSRHPTPTEMSAASRRFDAQGLTMRQAAEDIMWALINTTEFLYRH